MKDFEADESRFVTKVRWIIESRNGHLENFKALGDINNTVIPHIMQDYQGRARQCDTYNMFWI